MKISACIAVLAFCLIAPASSALAGEPAAGLPAASAGAAAPMTLAYDDDGPCQRRCNARHQACKKEGRNDCYSRMQACWNACRR
jgi:hypothetical protein